MPATGSSDDSNGVDEPSDRTEHLHALERAVHHPRGRVVCAVIEQPRHGQPSAGTLGQALLEPEPLRKRDESVPPTVNETGGDVDAGQVGRRIEERCHAAARLRQPEGQVPASCGVGARDGRASREQIEKRTAACGQRVAKLSDHAIVAWIPGGNPLTTRRVGQPMEGGRNVTRVLASRYVGQVIAPHYPAPEWVRRQSVLSAPPLVLACELARHGPLQAAVPPEEDDARNVFGHVLLGGGDGHLGSAERKPNQPEPVVAHLRPTPE